jgi:N-acetylmuramoyl-L-alanine amidase
LAGIHANGIDGRPDVNGLETYHFNKDSEKLANTVHRTVLNQINNSGSPVLTDRGVRTARFLILRKSAIPAIEVDIVHPNTVLYFSK